jgi:hypothetical protein
MMFLARADVGQSLQKIVRSDVLIIEGDPKRQALLSERQFTQMSHNV